MDDKPLTFREIEDFVGSGCDFLEAFAYGDTESEMGPFLGDAIYCPYCGAEVPKQWLDEDGEIDDTWHGTDCGLVRTITGLTRVKKMLYKLS